MAGGGRFVTYLFDLCRIKFLGVGNGYFSHKINTGIRSVESGNPLARLRLVFFSIVLEVRQGFGLLIDILKVLDCAFLGAFDIIVGYCLDMGIQALDRRQLQNIGLLLGHFDSGPSPVGPVVGQKVDILVLGTWIRFSCSEMTVEDEVRYVSCSSTSLDY